MLRCRALTEMATAHPAEAVTIADWIDAGLRLGLTAPRTLELARREGYRCRTAEFYERWRERRGQMIRAGALAEDNGG